MRDHASLALSTDVKPEVCSAEFWLAGLTVKTSNRLGMSLPRSHIVALVEREAVFEWGGERRAYGNEVSV